MHSDFVNISLKSLCLMHLCHLPICFSERKGLSQCCSCAETFLCLSPDSAKHSPKVGQLLQ